MFCNERLQGRTWMLGIIHRQAPHSTAGTSSYVERQLSRTKRVLLCFEDWLCTATPLPMRARSCILTSMEAQQSCVLVTPNEVPQADAAMMEPEQTPLGALLQDYDGLQAKSHATLRFSFPAAKPRGPLPRAEAKHGYFRVASNSEQCW